MEPEHRRLAAYTIIRTLPFFVCFFVFLCWLIPSANAENNALDEIGQTMDSSADPCTDFYRYACGGWLDNTQLNSYQISSTRGFDLAEQDIESRLKFLFEEAARLYPSGDPDQDRVGAFYQSCMDAEANPPTNLSFLDPYMDQIDTITNRAQFMLIAGQLHKIGVNRLFNLEPIPNFIDAKAYTLLLSPGDPAFPDGDIYTRNDPSSKALRAAGVSYINQVLTQLGEPADLARQHTRHIMAIEKVLSKYHDYYGNSGGLAYPSAPEDLRILNSNIAWENFFSSIKTPANQGLFVSPTFIIELGRVLEKLPIHSLKAYLRWSLINSFRNFVPNEYYRNIHSEVLFKTTGTPTAEFCAYQTSQELGDAVAKLLSANDPYEESSQLAASIVSNIKQGFQQNLSQAPWLDNTSLAATKAKLDAMTEQFSYPAVWPDYSGLVFDPRDLFKNIVKARSDNFFRSMSRYGQVVDRNAWEFSSSPQTVNAFYFNLKNQIHLLAGLLRPPFLDANAPPTLNYAGVGVIAAHEVMHGFNLYGRFYQPDGHFGRLWNKKVNRAFSKRSSCVSKQYSKFQVSPKLKVKGKATLEENLADVNGLKLAFQAWQNIPETQPDFVINQTAFSAEQVFFIRYAQQYCSLNRPGAEEYFSSRSWWRYAPDRYRAIGPIINRPEFAQAFNCPLGSVMNPAKKCTVW